VSPGRRAELVVERWLMARGLAPERFPPKRRRLTKTPDFRVAVPAGGAFLLEVKTLVRAEPGYGGVFLKLVRARAQFDGVNQGGHLANVLAFVAQAPERLAPMLAELAPQPAAPLKGLDLVLGLAPAGVLHRAPGSGHAPLLARALDGAPRHLLGELP